MSKNESLNHFRKSPEPTNLALFASSGQTPPHPAPLSPLGSYLSRFFRVLTSRLRPSLASVASSSSRWSLRRDALARVASSSASSSCRLSCFILALAFSILGKVHESGQTKLVSPTSVTPHLSVLAHCRPVSPVGARCAHMYTCACT